MLEKYVGWLKRQDELWININKIDIWASLTHAAPNKRIHPLTKLLLLAVGHPPKCLTSGKNPAIQWIRWKKEAPGLRLKGVYRKIFPTSVFTGVKYLLKANLFLVTDFCN